MNTLDHSGSQENKPEFATQVLQPVLTADGSHTLYSPAVNQHYHSTFGAIAESEHIFIRSGLSYYAGIHRTDIIRAGEPIRILEVGFGTGLNALLSFQWAEETGVRVQYVALEAHPIDVELSEKLNFPEMTGRKQDDDVFRRIHHAAWDTEVALSGNFSLIKIKKPVEAFEANARAYHIVFYDAFDPVAQPELWTADVLGKVAKTLANKGILMTYSVRGHVVRLLKSLGFGVEKLAGPPGKRHILRATAGKNSSN